ncbi:MAG: DUF5677 domain-containing protein [Candidatus Aenigmatarchaeota archaeon]
MNNKFYKDLDKVNEEMIKFLNSYSKSNILQKFYISSFKSFFYGNLINAFFTNLNAENIEELQLPKDKVLEIKKKYRNVIKQIKLATSLKLNKIDEKYYNAFKNQIKKDFPVFVKLIDRIERSININKAKNFLKKKEKKIKKSGNSNSDINSFFIIKSLEACIKKERGLPNINKIDRIMRVFIKKLLPKFSKAVVKNLKKNSKEMLNSQRTYQGGFEYKLYVRWKESIDLLECLIRISMESGEEHRNKISKSNDKTNDYKRVALIKIHARAVHIANEILILLKSGYPDGANARWRTLHELAVISFFLSANNSEVSQRYLEHEMIKKFKEAKDYRNYYKKLGFPSFGRKDFNRLKKEKEKLCNKYNDKFQGEYGWIPSKILSDRNFRTLEKHVRLDRLHPFYNLSNDAVHGGPKGFYRLGLMNAWQDKLHLVGASNYGLALPIQNTVISLLHVTVCLLGLEPDFESLMQMQIICIYVDEICPIAAKIQKQIEKEEASKISP